MEEITYKPIGKIRTPHRDPKGTPIQPPAAEGIEGRIEILDEYVEGLKDLDGFSHVILLYHFHLMEKMTLTATPFIEDREHGIFAIRAPSRPNPIGLSIVRLVEIEGNILHIKDVDIVDGSPLLGIKPYMPGFDRRENVRFGWLENNIDKLPDKKDNGRFVMIFRARRI